MIKPIEIEARDVRELMKLDPTALMVCAYESDDEFHNHELEGSISLDEFYSREASLSLEQPIIFYCACQHDEAAIFQAIQKLDEGFRNVKILKGGVNAWKNAGFPILEKV